MKDLAAAEHAVHVIWAKKGYRTVYPAINHGSIFTKTMEIVMHVERIHELIQASSPTVRSMISRLDTGIDKDSSRSG
jgi:hypothetical protein